MCLHGLVAGLRTVLPVLPADHHIPFPQPETTLENPRFELATALTQTITTIERAGETHCKCNAKTATCGKDLGHLDLKCVPDIRTILSTLSFPPR